MRTLSRILLGAVFVLSAIAKLSSMEGFELYIFSFGFTGFDLASFAARLVVIAELALGIGLIFNMLFKPVKRLVAIFLGGFSLFLVWRALLGDTESCHCMGDVVDMNPVQSLIKNLVLGVLLAFAWNSDGGKFRRQGLVSLLVTTAAAVTVFAVNPPDIFFRLGPDSRSSDLVPENFRPAADSLGLAEGRRLVCFYSASCEHCAHCASKMAGIIRRHDIPTDSVYVVFMQTHINQDSVATAFYKEHGQGLALPYSYLHPYSFIPMTNGSMPLVTLFKGGELIREYDYLSIDESEIASFFYPQWK